MNDLIVVAFDRFDDARTALRRLRELERAGRIAFEDTALVEREGNGRVRVKNEVSGTTEKAAVIGAVLGGILTFAFPPVGAAIGAGAGAAIGASLDTGVNARFLDDVTSSLTPGRSALFLVVRSAEVDPVMAALRTFTGEVIHTTLTPEAEQALSDSMRRTKATSTR